MNFLGVIRNVTHDKMNLIFISPLKKQKTTLILGTCVVVINKLGKNNHKRKRGKLKERERKEE